ncbi:amidohydrolase family protein [Acrocarpospora catenulata]|uniref:amidohydrolase family protein n=1 Tax=Acrocarpospora catenulata TaxID=2836182 RepID=UPI001BD9321E|nr:amidohydrolase family protein [Acrocarpospora catenulata]
MGAVDYWCNIFTPEGIRQTFEEPKEISDVVKWWGLKFTGKSVEEFVASMDDADVDVVLIPSAKMASYETSQLIWNVREEQVVEIADSAPGRVKGLFGIDPREGMAGVRRLEEWIGSGHFVGAHLHPYGFNLPVNHRRFYPFYAKCAELGVPVVMQVGHSAERMPSEMGRPLLIDDIALDFPELSIVGAHTGWPWVEELIALAWKHRNVYIGTSAHHPKYWDPSLVRFANSRGKGKVLFGTDYPVMDHKGALKAVIELPFKDEARELVVGGAARSIFKLAEPGSHN